MQLDTSGREGIDDSNQTTSEKNGNDVDLEQYFKQNGLTQQAYSKIADDVASGDINAKMLMNCGDNELNDIADGYKLTWIQKKTFVNAVKLLNQHSKSNHNDNQEQQFIYVSPQEQSILDQINKLTKVLTQHTNKCIKVKQDNKNRLESEILKLQEYHKLIQRAFDNAINNLIDKCRNEINNNDKKFENLQNKINKESNDLKMYRTQFKQYLNNKSKNDKNNNNNVSNDIHQTQSNVNKLLRGDDECIVPILIKNELNVDTFISQFVDKVNNSLIFSFDKKLKTTKLEAEKDNDEKKEMIMNSTNKVKKSKEKQGQASNRDKVSKIDWRFNFHHDFKNRGSKVHGIGSNGKNMKCDSNGKNCCLCFCTISDNGMKPNSGIYTIKIKIDSVESTIFCSNIIGITSEKYDNNDKELRNMYTWYDRSNNYIGWAADPIELKQLPNGLFCGWKDYGEQHNIFRKNNFIYQSKNSNYQNRLPGFKNGDIVVLSYDSTLNQLSFQKENDNGKLNSFIKNLPKNMTFYWFVAHFDKRSMSITIVD